MVGYLKGNFFVRYRSFESWAHLNQLAERWLADEADQRVHGTVKEVVAERFARERAALGPLPPHRYDTSYRELRQVAWDGYLDVRGNRYRVPGQLVGQTVVVRIDLEGGLYVYTPADAALDAPPVATHALRRAQDGWATVPDHHASLWDTTLRVEQRSLRAYEAVNRWNSTSC